MSMKQVLGRALVFVVLEVGALCGVPMDPVKIEELMKVLKRGTPVSDQTIDGDDDPDSPVSEADY